MDPYVTGGTIRTLREKKKLTQAALAEKICVSDRTVSKWETGRGYPDISLLQPLAAVLDVSLTELLSGQTVANTNVAANLLRGRFYICPVCGNILYAVGQATVSCHGITLPSLESEAPDEYHDAVLTRVEDELLLTVHHDMGREHHITFAAAVSCDRVQLIRLYPEGEAQVRLPLRGTEAVYYHCNRDGLFCLPVRR